MKRLLPFLTALAFLSAGPAMANPELARHWADEAKILEARINTSSEGALSPELVKDLTRFGRVAARLAESGGEKAPLPQDLACIFRGMAEETETQIAALNASKSGDDISYARKRLVKMLEDAAPVGQAAAISIEAGNVWAENSDPDQPGQCQAAAFDGRM